MAVIFEGPVSSAGAATESRAGQVALLHPAADAGEIMTFDKENWGGFAKFSAIFTNISGRESTNHQLQQTLGNRIYLDVFGDRIGTLQISGLAFLGNCGERTGILNTLFNPFETARRIVEPRIGIANVMKYYHENKLSKRASPVIVSVDPYTPYEGYMHTFQWEMFGEQHTANRLYQFSFVLAILPPEYPS